MRVHLFVIRLYKTVKKILDRDKKASKRWKCMESGVCTPVKRREIEHGK